MTQNLKQNRDLMVSITIKFGLRITLWITFNKIRFNVFHKQMIPPVEHHPKLYLILILFSILPNEMPNIDFTKLRLFRKGKRTKPMGVTDKIRQFILTMTDNQAHPMPEIKKIDEKDTKEIEGHYQYKIGEKILEKYEIRSILGEGTFGKVLLCKDCDSQKRYAIKVIRNIQRYRDAAKLEIDALNSLHNEDPTVKYPIVRLLDSFTIDGHVCLRFPVHGISTYEFLKANHYQPYRMGDVIHFADQLLRKGFEKYIFFLFTILLKFHAGFRKTPFFIRDR